MNKSSGGDGIPAELFQILKDDAVKLLHNMSANLENSTVATGLEKVSFHSNPQKKAMPKNVWGLPCSSTGKEYACNAGDPGLIPGTGRSPGERNGYPLKYSCLENPINRILVG